MKLSSISAVQPGRRPAGVGGTPSVKKASADLARLEAARMEAPRVDSRVELRGDSLRAKNERERIIKKRVRLRPETRDQLLERLRNPQLSLHEASILLRVSRATVRRYADAGRLPCLRTPGGQRRFTLRDIENFYRQLKMRR